MALVTDSFCERCGTKYVFQAPPAKALSMKSARVLARGLRNFVMNDGQSFEDSINAARHEDSSADSSRLTQAFHRAFNFCMSCRQYACEQCWNPKAGACLTCAPMPSSAPSPEPDHLIARVPVTRLDVETPEPAYPPLPQQLPTQASYAGPAAFGGPASSGGTASFSAGRLVSDSANEPDEVQPGWPEADRAVAEPELPVAEADASIAEAQAELPNPSGRAPVWVLRRGSVDGETVAEQIQDHRDLWPIADPLAPEATLTPEELSLVEAHLGRSDADLDAENSPVVAELLPLAPIEAQAEVAAPAAALPPAHAYERLPEPIAEPPAYAAVPVPAVREPLVSEPAAPPPTGHLEPQAPRDVEPPLPMAFMALRGTPSNGIWPHPTLWLDRPKKSYSPIFSEEAVQPPFAEEAITAETAAVVDEGAAMPVAEISTGEPMLMAPEPAAEQMVQAVEPAAEPVFVAPPAQEMAAAEMPPLSPIAAAPLPAPIPEAPARVPEPPVVSPEPSSVRDVPVGVAWQQRLMAAQAAARTEAARAEAAQAEAARVAAEQIPAQPVVVPQPIQAPIPAPVPVLPIPSARPVQPPIAPTPAAPAYQPAPAPEAPAYQEQPVPGWPPLGAQWPAPVSSGPVWPAPAGVATPAAMLTPKAEATTEMWAQSAQEVMNRGTVRVCHHCSLPLSTHARFCRRCGTSQS